MESRGWLLRIRKMLMGATEDKLGFFLRRQAIPAGAVLAPCT